MLLSPHIAAMPSRLPSSTSSSSLSLSSTRVCATNEITASSIIDPSTWHSFSRVNRQLPPPSLSIFIAIIDTFETLVAVSLTKNTFNANVRLPVRCLHCLGDNYI